MMKIKLIKTILFSICLLAPSLNMTAMVLIKEGTIWRYSMGNGLSARTVDFTLERIDDHFGKECFGLYVTDTEDMQKILYHILHYDGTCVYLLENEQTDNWFLMYDFGMEPGDFRMVTRVFLGPWETFGPNDYVTCPVFCKGREKNGGFDNETEIMIVREINETRDHIHTWIVGCGNADDWGFLLNVHGGYVGGGMRLLSIESDGQIIYQYQPPETGIDQVDTPLEDNDPAEWYTLQGVRVDNPQNGIFIRRQGANITKQVIK